MAFSVDSKIKDILAVPKARAAIDAIAPGILNDPMVGLVKGMSIRQASTMLPRFMPVILKKIDSVLAKIDDTPPSFDFDEIIDRRHTNSLKVEAGFSNPDLPDNHLAMWVADMDFACPQPILDAMKARIDQRILGYGMIGEPAYYETVAQWMRRRHGWDIDAGQICHTNGVMDAIRLCIERFTSPGDGVIFQTPCYAPFHFTTTALNRVPVHNPLIHTDGEFTVDFALLEQQCADPANTMLLLCNPHNPTGRVFTHQELQRLGDLCIQYNIFLISDEIHADILRAGQTHIPVASLFPSARRIITCTSPSKIFNLGGLHIANTIFNDSALAQQWRDGYIAGLPNPVSVAACTAAYTACDDWADAVNRYISGTIARVADELHAAMPRVQLSIPEGTYLLWLDLRSYGLDNDALRKKIATAGLHVEYADDFIANADGFVRINLACPRAVAQDAVARLKRAFADV